MQKKIKLAKSKSVSYLKLPFDFFEMHFRKMKSETVKLYIYILYLCTLGNVELNDKELSERLGISIKSISQGYNELREYGLIVYNSETGEEELINPEDFYKNLHKQNNSEIKKEAKDKIKALDFDEGYRNIFDFFESIFCKPLNQNEMLEIYDLLNNQKVPFEVLACAASYSEAKGKKNVSYIAKVALNWKELGLTNYESCEKYISSEIIPESEELGRENLYFTIKKLFGLSRELYDAEKKYVDDWYYNLKKSFEEIKKAFDITVINTGKISFPYINKILINGDKTPEKITPVDKKSLNNFTERGYDYDSIMNALRKKQNG